MANFIATSASSKTFAIPIPPARFRFQLQKDKLRDAELYDGHFLLRSNLTGREPARLWKLYMRLLQIEAVFKSWKHDLRLRPVYHRVEGRVEAHMFVCFLAYCLQVTLQQRLTAVALVLERLRMKLPCGNYRPRIESWVRSALLVLTALTLLIGCDKAEPVADDVVVGRKRTAPPEATVLRFRELIRKDYTASASWEFETDWSWVKDTEWVTNNIASTYHVVHIGSDRLVWRRSRPGDVYFLTIEQTKGVSARRFRASFTATPK
jgi:hypothetical protein